MSEHVHDWLHAHVEGVLGADDACRVAEHLRVCEECRREHEAVRAGIEALRSLTPTPVPADSWERIERGLAAQVGPRRSLFSLPRLIAASVTVAVLGGGVAFWSLRGAGPSWTVTSLDGAPQVGAHTVVEQAKLAVGKWLVTDERSRARLDIGDIGHIDLEPRTRVQLLEAEETEHRVALEVGTIHAFVFAPPRLFIVETPSAAAVDLGCAYTLTVAGDGAARLEVTSGHVALELGGRESWVPRGAVCETRAGKGPGTPYFADAPAPLREALARFDFEDGGEPALAAVLDAAGPRDTLTLWHLLARTPRGMRDRVHARLAELSPPPAGAEGALDLDEQALQRWRSDLEQFWW